MCCQKARIMSKSKKTRPCPQLHTTNPNPPLCNLMILIHCQELKVKTKTPYRWNDASFLIWIWLKVVFSSFLCRSFRPSPSSGRPSVLSEFCMKRWTWQKAKRKRENKENTTMAEDSKPIAVGSAVLLSKTSVRAKLPRIFMWQAFGKLKLSISRKTSSTFHPNRGFRAHKLKIDPVRVFLASYFYTAQRIWFAELPLFSGTRALSPLPRRLTLHHVCAALPLRFIQRPTSPRHKMLRLPRNYKMQQHKMLRLPGENDTVALTR